MKWGLWSTTQRTYFQLASSCGGRNRTCVAAINSRLPVPAQDQPHHISQRGRIRTDVLVRPRHADCQPFPHAEVKSAQSDLNRPNCPGRAARYRYVIGAKSSGQIVKDPENQMGPDGLEPSSDPYKEPALTVELQACISWRSIGPEDSNPHRAS